MNRVGVVGLGTMGAGIAEVFAKAQLEVVGLEVGSEALERGQATVSKSLDRQVSRGRLDETTRAAIAERISFSTDFAELSNAGLVIEAVPERMEIKRSLFSQLDTACGPETILATNTSSLSVTHIAEITGRPAAVLGMHFFNPAPVMKLVEIVTTTHSDPAVVATVEALAAQLGKTAVTVSDRPGFIVNRLLLGYLNQAAKLVGTGQAKREEVDAALSSTGLPMGPLLLLDVIGLDTCVEILDCIHDTDGGSPRHDAAGILRELVAEGKLGKKTGHGFYDHSQAIPTAQPAATRTAALVAELVPPHVGEAQAMADSGYASPSDIDTAMRLGCGYPNGIFGLIP